MRYFAKLTIECEVCGVEFAPSDVRHGEMTPDGEGRSKVVLSFADRCPVCHSLDDLFDAARRVRSELSKGYLSR